MKKVIEFIESVVVSCISGLVLGLLGGILFLTALAIVRSVFK